MGGKEAIVKDRFSNKINNKVRTSNMSAKGGWKECTKGRREGK